MSARDVPVVGVVGGGQLARMMYQAAISLGVELRVLAATAEDSAALVAHHVTVGDWHDVDVLRAFAEACDVVTFDHELVDAGTVERLAATGTVVRPSARALRHAADKAHQRSLCASLGIATPPHVVVTGASDPAHAIDPLGYPMVAKLARGGYDGRGVFWVADADQIIELLERLGPDTVVVVEPQLTLHAELATQVVRGADGTIVRYPVVRTHQQDGICRMVEAPADIAPAVADQAHAWAAALADAIGLVVVTR